METFEIYLQTFDWRHFDKFEVFWNESLLWCGIYLVFVLYLLVFSGKLFFVVIIWKIFFLHFWKISYDDIFENMFVGAILGKIFVDAVFWLPLTQSCTPPGLFILTVHFVPHQLKSLFMLWSASKSSNLQLGRPCF